MCMLMTLLVDHKVNTGDAIPVRQPACRLPFHQKAEVRQLLDNMICYPGSNGHLLRKDGSTRFSAQFQKVNDVTQKDAQPLPRIDDILDAMEEVCYFTLNLESGYWQAEVDLWDQEKTAFVMPSELHQFGVMPSDYVKFRPHFNV